MLDIKDLHASVEEKDVLKGLNLKVNAGEVHAIMGPNGAGKSSHQKLLRVILPTKLPRGILSLKLISRAKIS